MLPSLVSRPQRRFRRRTLTARASRAFPLVNAVLVLALLALSVSTGFVTPAHAATFVVNSTVDAPDANPGDGICETAPGNSSCTLRAAIQEANALAGADSISLPAGTYSLTRVGAAEAAAATGDLDITDHLTISGPTAGGAVVSGDSIDRAFEIIEPAMVTISRVEVRDGADPGGEGGGGIRNSGGNLTLIGVVLRENTTSAGGGIYNDRGALSLTNSSLFGNSASEGAAIYNNAGIVTLTAVTLSDNSSNAGSIYNAGGTLTVIGSTLSPNHSRFGAGIANRGGTVAVTRSTIAGNTAASGGGVHNDGGLMTLTDTTLSGNDVAFSGGSGGAIFNLSGQLTLTNATVVSNSVNAEFGSGLGGGIANAGTMTVTNSTIAGNSASSGGGISNSGTATLRNTIVANSPSGENCAGATITSLGHNLDSGIGCGFTAPGDLSNTSPMLGPFQNNGGPGLTHALLSGSPAIDAGTNDGCPSTDQRGVPRPQDGNGDGTAVCDMGAYELQFTALQVSVDIKPQACPNPLNVDARGVLPVAVLGTSSFTVASVDPATIRLEGVPAQKSALGDVATPFVGEQNTATDCSAAGADGFLDLSLKFDGPAVAAALGMVTDGEVLSLRLTGNLTPELGETPITGQDVVVIVRKVSLVSSEGFIWLPQTTR